MQGSIKKRLTIIAGAALAFAVIFFLLRGPYLSNYTKRLIIPALENATGERIIIDNAVINLFPFYIQAKGFKVFDKDGNRLLWLTKTRAYIDLSSLLSGEVRIRKLSLKEPELTVSEADIRRIIENVKKNVARDGVKSRRLSVRNIDLTDGRFAVRNEKGTAVSGSGVFFEMTTKNDVAARLRVKEGILRSPGLAEVRGDLGGSVKITDGGIQINEVDIRSSKSFLKAKGQVLLGPGGALKGGSLSGSAEIHEDAFRHFFDLKTEREGVLSFDGRVGMTVDEEAKSPRFTVDLETDSKFRLETLMELVKVKEDISGEIAVKGKISGTFPELSGSGTVKFHDGVLGGLRIGDLDGDIAYGENKFSLSRFKARAYGGEMEGRASLLLPYGDYMVDAEVSHAGSPEFFKFIKWEPPFPAGEINGRFLLTHNHGEGVEVEADASYHNTTKKEGDLLSRLNTIRCRLHLKDDVLRLKQTALSTAVSELLLDGSIDLANNMMSLDVRLDSREVSDITAPYYSKFIAPASFRGRAAGALKDPEITGTLEAGPGSIHGLMFTRASADLNYRMSSLSVSRLDIAGGKATYEASGTIEFRKAEGLFSFKGPYYKATAEVKGAELKPFVTMLYRDIPVSGPVDGTLSFEGDHEKFVSSGDLVVRDGVVYGQQFDRVSVRADLHPGRVEFYSVTAQRGDSVLNAKGKLSFDGKFTLDASSAGTSLSDINLFRDLPLGGSAALSVEGSGTFEKPDIGFSARLREVTFKGMRAGKGDIEGRLKGKEVSAKGAFMDGRITADASAVISPRRTWSADIDFRKGNYDFLLSGFMKSPPEDLALSLEGKVKMKGEGSRLSLTSRFAYLNCSAYGFTLRNAGDIVVELADRGLAIKSFALTGDHAKLSVGGELKPDKQLDVKVKGSLDLAPLKVLSDKFASLKGRGDISVDIIGPWEKPDVTGEVNVIDAAASLTEYPYKIGPVNGTVFLKKDRFAFDDVKTVFGGGKITMSGVGYLSGVSVKRVFLSSSLTGINVRPMDDVSASFDGRLFYETSDKGAVLSGSLDVKKARYGKDLEFSKWLIDLREINREAVRYPAFLKNTEFNVYISGADNITIDNNLAKAPVNLAVTLTGNIARPGLIGRIEAQEGTIYFRSNEFRILEGSSVDFVDASRITPVFHLLAETYTGDYFIKMNLDGTIDKFTLSLFSDPPLSEMEILNLLTFGQTRKASKGLESGIAASEAASILAGGLQDVVQEKFKGITGFERFKIEPNTTAAGAIAPRITIGKRLLEDRLFVIYSTSVGTTEENVIRLEYRVSKNISLVGSKDEIGSVGGDVKYRFEFK
ncbi:MAG: translocation/assembly module TamB domain-containing protein [Nitrospirae bacterium]|nr:translocation/assembly module TamB domain-containing protein [Nitrospirota bacterium]